MVRDKSFDKIYRLRFNDKLRMIGPKVFRYEPGITCFVKRRIPGKSNTKGLNRLLR